MPANYWNLDPTWHEALPSRPATVDYEHAAGGKATAGAGQINRCSLDFLELTPAANNGGSDNVGFDIGIMGNTFVHFR